MVEDVSNQLVSIEARSGLFRRLGTPESLLRVSEFVGVPGIAGTPYENALREYLPRTGTHLSPSWRKLAGKLRDFFTLAEVRVVNTVEAWLPVEVHALYCPPGGTASLKLESSDSDGSTCRLELLGTGGGDDFDVTFKVTDRFDDSKSSLAVIYQIKSTWEHCQLTRVGHQPAFFQRLAGVQEQLRRVEVTALQQLAPQPTWGEVVDDVTYDLRTSPAAARATLETSIGQKWEDKLGIDLGDLGFKASVKFVGTKKYKTVYGYKLPPGRRYRARQFENGGWWWWSVAV